MRTLAKVWIVANVKDDPADVILNALHLSPKAAWDAAVRMYFGPSYAGYTGYADMLRRRGYRAIKVQLVMGGKS